MSDWSCRKTLKKRRWMKRTRANSASPTFANNQLLGIVRVWGQNNVAWVLIHRIVRQVENALNGHSSSDHHQSIPRTVNSKVMYSSMDRRVANWSQVDWNNVRRPCDFVGKVECANLFVFCRVPGEVLVSPVLWQRINSIYGYWRLILTRISQQLNWRCCFRTSC